MLVIKPASFSCYRKGLIFLLPLLAGLAEKAIAAMACLFFLPTLSLISGWAAKVTSR
jgi:hypothetical protein